MSELTIACVLRSGGIYTDAWVERLQRGIERNITTPHSFVCLSDVPVSCKRIPLITDWPGWWSKLELFRPGLFDGPVLYFDLDTLIVGNLDRIVRHKHVFTGAHEYNRPTQFCSTAMMWEGDFGIFEAFDMSLARNYRTHKKIGDQAFIEDHLNATGVKWTTFRDLFGERTVASYKIHKCQVKPPKDAVAVAFHGKPKPHEINFGWVASQWSC